MAASPATGVSRSKKYMEESYNGCRRGDSGLAEMMVEIKVSDSPGIGYQRGTGTQEARASNPNSPSVFGEVLRGIFPTQLYPE